MGEDASYAYESTADYRREVLAITGAYGKQIDIMDEATGGYKSTYQILKELSEVWDEIDDAGKQSLLYTLGGARQVNVLSAILKNFDDAEAVVKSAADATGSALAENDKYLDSIMGKWGQVQASFQALSETLIDNEAIKMLLDLANALLQVADAGAKVSGGLLGISAGLIGYTIFSEKGLFEYGDISADRTLLNLLKPYGYEGSDVKGSPKNLLAHLKYGAQGAYATDAATLRKVVSAKFTDDYLKTFDKADDLIAALTETDKLSESTRKNLNEIFDAQFAKGENVTVSMLNNVASGLDKTSVKATKMMNTLKGIGKSMLWAAAITAAIKLVSTVIDASITTVEEHQEKVKEYTDKISTAREELEKLYQLQENSIGITDADKERIKYLEQYIKLLEESSRLEQEELNRKNLLEGHLFSNTEFSNVEKILNNNISAKDGIQQESIGDATIRKAQELVHRAAYGNVNMANKWILPALQEEVNEGYSQLIDDYTTLFAYADNLNNAAKFTQDSNEKKAYEQRLKLTEDKMSELQSQIDTLLSLGIISGREDYSLFTSETKYKKKDTWNIFDNYKGKDVTKLVNGETITIPIALSSKNAEHQAENLQQILKDVQATSFDQLNTEIDNMQSAVSTVVKAYTEYSTTGAYTLDTLQALTNIDSRYIDLLIDEEGQLNLNEEAIRDLTTARVEELRMKILQTAIADIEALTDEAAATKVVESAKLDEATAMRESTQAVLENVAAEMVLKGVTEGFGEVQQEAINIIINRANALMKAVDVSGVYADRTNAAKDATDKMNDALKDQGNLLLKALDNRKKPLEDEIEAIDDKKEALQDELDKLNEIYEAEDKEFKLQKLKDAYERAKANKTVRLYTHDKGWQWVADPAEVKEAEDAYKEYQKELERDEARKVIEDQIDALDDAKEAVQEQIDAIDDLKEKVQEAMDNIGLTQEEHLAQTQLLAELEGLTYDQLAAKVADYANTVINSYNQAATAAANYNAVVAAGATEASKVENVGVSHAYQSENYRSGKQAQLNQIYDDTPKRSYVTRDGRVVYYHTGGFVKGLTSTANVSPAFRAYMDRLERDEVPAVLEAGEFVLTKQHQKAILDDRTALANVASNNRNISLEIGDIHINNPVGDVNTLSNAIIRQLPNQVLKDLYNK